MTALGDTGKGAGMLSEEFLKVIQADRKREIEAADRVRSLRSRDAAESSVQTSRDPVRADVRPTVRPAHAGTAATDPCV